MADEIPCTIATAKPGTVHAWLVPESHGALLPNGPWNVEPTKVQWVDAATDLPCLVVRNQLGNLCGYAGVTKDHPLFQKFYDDVDHERVSVHGGLTYSDLCRPAKSEAQGVCHIAEPGSDDRVWWFGFDCAHCGDMVPYQRSWHSMFDRTPEWETYKDMGYVASEVTRLAEQLFFYRLNEKEAA